VFLIRAAIEGASVIADLRVVKDGEQAVTFFDDTDRDETVPVPDLVILDINLPRKPGGEVLQHLRRSRRSRDARVIAVSTSDSPGDRAEMSRLGANAYFHKPSDYADFLKLGETIRQVLS
jgi:chemotaxis family two-component system response regulator Rcp1